MCMDSCWYRRFMASVKPPGAHLILHSIEFGLHGVEGVYVCLEFLLEGSYLPFLALQLPTPLLPVIVQTSVTHSQSTPQHAIAKQVLNKMIIFWTKQYFFN